MKVPEQSEGPEDGSPVQTQHKVVRGDTLLGIAVRYDVPVSWLKHQNGLRSDRDIFPGDMLTITRPPSVDAMKIVEVDLIDLMSLSPISEGRILLLGKTLRFEPKSGATHPIVVELADNMDVSILHHPDAESRILSISESVSSDSAPGIYAFVGLAEALESFREEVKTRVVLAPSHVPYENVPPGVTAQRSRTILTTSTLPEVSFFGSDGLAEDEDISRFRQRLASHDRLSNWHLVYQMSKDGNARGAFLDKVQKLNRIVIIVKTAAGDRVVIYLSRGILVCLDRPLAGEVVLMGNGEIYTRQEFGKDAEVFCSFSLEDFTVRDKQTACLWLDQFFLHGISEPCRAFNSRCLTREREFDVIDLEVWHLRLAGSKSVA